MIAFKGLYKKELKLSLVTFTVGLILINVITIASLTLKEYFDEPLIPAIMFFILIVMHVFYLPGMVFSSLQIEGQSQLWLHNPSGGNKLFLAKILAGMTYYTVSLLASILLAKLSMTGITMTEDYEGISAIVKENLFIMGGGITLSSIYLSVWVLFYWALYHSLKGVPFLNKIRWLVILVVWVLTTAVWDFIENITVVEVIKEKGTININFFDARFGNNSVSAEMLNFSITSMIMYLLITIGVFLAAVWLLDRKVEV